MKPALAHHGQKSDGLKGNRLAAGVGSRDYKGVVILAYGHIYGNYLLRVDERMSCFLKIKISTFIYCRLFSLHHTGKLSLCKYNIHVYEQLLVVHYVVEMLCHIGGKLCQI